MNPQVRQYLLDAQACLQVQNHTIALQALHHALQQLIPGSPRAWSKIMLTIRATKRAIALQESV